MTVILDATEALTAGQPLSVTECIGILNETLEMALPVLMVEGEIGSFKINQGKYVFFDVKDDKGTLGCFMMVHQLRTPLENGMRVRLVVTPRITAWGKFSLTVRAVTLVGEGTLQRAYQLLKQRLTTEGLFSDERKRPLPEYPERIAVISSRQAAGFADFMKIAAARWPLANITVEHVRVQGAGAADDIIAAIARINAQANGIEAIVLIRGGGSADDLACFNDEPLVRAIAASRVPLIAGIGHEVDETLASLAADVMASTPSNAAELLLPDSAVVAQALRQQAKQMNDSAKRLIQDQRQTIERHHVWLDTTTRQVLVSAQQRLRHATALLNQLNPQRVLSHGYAIVRQDGAVLRDGGRLKAGDHLTIQLAHHYIESEVTRVTSKD